MSPSRGFCYNRCMASTTPQRWFLAAGAAALCAAGAWLQAHRAHVLVPGDRMAALPLKSLSSKPVHLPVPDGRPEVINVFATWCPPCRAEMPGFVAAAAELRARGVRVVGIDRGEPPATVRAFMQRYGITYPVYIDDGGVTHDRLGARMIPTTIWVGARGYIRAEHAGPLATEPILGIARVADR